MAKKRDMGRKDSKPDQEKALSRRDFVTRGPAAGTGASVPSGTAPPPPTSSGAHNSQWKY